MTRTYSHSIFLFAFAAAIAALLFAVGGRTAAAASPMNAAAIKEAFDSVRESLAGLLAAKDEQRIDELRFRINAYRDILRFTATEIQDVRMQLGVDGEPAAAAAPTGTQPALTPEKEWRLKILKGFDEADEFIEGERVWLNAEEGVLSLDGIRDRAGVFQKWREGTYQRVMEPAREYLLVGRQVTIVDTAARRQKKIGEDVTRLRRARVRGSADLAKRLAQADLLIKEASALEAEARKAFTAANFEPQRSAATTTTSTAPLPSPAAGEPEPSAATGTVATSTATQSAEGTSTAAVLQAAAPPPNPKELVRQSLEKIQAAYRLFLEMSNAVQQMLK